MDCDVYRIWGGLLYETLLCDGGTEVVKVSAHLNRLQQLANAFHIAWGVDGGRLILDQYHMAVLLKEHLPTLEQEQCTFVNYVNSPLLDQLIQVYILEWPLNIQRNRPLLKHVQNNILDKACRLGCFDFVTVFLEKTTLCGHHIRTLVPCIFNAILWENVSPPVEFVSTWYDTLQPHMKVAAYTMDIMMDPWLLTNIRLGCSCDMICDWYKLLVKRGRYDEAGALFSVTCRGHNPVGMEEAIAGSPYHAGWTDAYQRAFHARTGLDPKNIDWIRTEVFFTVCKYGSVHTAPGLFQVMTEQFLALKEPLVYIHRIARLFFDTAASGHIGLLDELLAALRRQGFSDDWMNVWRVAVQHSFFGATNYGRVFYIVPMITMLLRHCTFYNCVISFQATLADVDTTRWEFHEDDLCWNSTSKLQHLHAIAMDAVFELLFHRVHGSDMEVSICRYGRIASKANVELLDILRKHFGNSVADQWAT
jgi:hypothetical protein